MSHWILDSEVAVMLAAERNAQRATEVFFRRVADAFSPSSAKVLLVAHVLPSQWWFVDSLQRLTGVAAVLAKPKSVDDEILRALQVRYRCDPLDRLAFANASVVLECLEDCGAGAPVVLVDVGGYFASVLPELCARYSGRIVGVVEDTENGLRRYERLGMPPCAVYSVARSPLKKAEDTLVGESIVFSAEALLRAAGVILPGRRACVLGFGKVGASIARTLRARNVHATVIDTDPVRLVHASAGGFAVATEAAAVLPDAELVFSATGNRALSTAELARVRDGAYIVSATSRDDEFAFGLETVQSQFSREIVAPQIARYWGEGRCFHLVNDGDAVNFLHGSEVGPSIHLVQAEILTAVARLTCGSHSPGFYDVPAQTRAQIAATWLEVFHSPAAGPSAAKAEGEAA